jgi:excinuclease ABC subunit A
MAKDKIIIKGAREHNLQNIDLEIPRDKLIVVTGLSGSGKSSLAFDTIYAEGQRRYVESLSAYARQFLGQMDKPDVDYIEGLSPAISIDQKTTSRNPRSTVGTVTEIYDYLRLLFARIGHPHCPKCGRPISQQTVEQIVDKIMALPERSRIQLLAPVIRGKKGEHLKVLDDIRKSGFVRVRIDGEITELNEEIKLAKTKKHTIEVVVDRIIVRPGVEKRLADSLETALNLSGSIVLVDVIGQEELVYSQNLACTECGISMEELSPRMFSFNTPYGACPECDGLGFKMEIDPDLVIPNPHLSLREGAIAPWSGLSNGYYSQLLQSVGKEYGFDLDTSVEKMSPEQVNAILYGTGKQTVLVDYDNGKGRRGVYKVVFEGVIPNLARRYRETQSEYIRREIEQYMSTNPCMLCEGTRLRAESLAVTVGGKTIAQLTQLSIRECQEFFNL